MTRPTDAASLSIIQRVRIPEGLTPFYAQCVGMYLE